MRVVKFGVLEQTQGLHLHAKCHLNVFIVSASGGQKPQVWANFDIWGLLYRPHFTNEGQMWCAIADPRYRPTLTCHISSRSVYSVALCWRKTPIFAVFWTSAFRVVAIWQQSDKVEHGCTTTTPTASKSFLCSNAFIAKSGAQSLTFKNVTNKQTDRQTITQRFWPPRRRVKSEPHQTWHGDRGPRARSCISKTFGGLTHSFAARGH